MIDADFLLGRGFTVVAPHRYFPRLRLELDKGLGWKAEVEAALERLLDSAQLQQPVGAGAGAAAGSIQSRAALLDGLLVGQQFGEGERPGGPVVLAEQVQPLHRGQDSLGDRVAALAGSPAWRGRADW